jgi:hypothetical protein
VPLISASPPSGVHTRRTTISPWVRVPVLSVPRTVTDPSVSTAGSRLISARLADILRAPSASARVTTAGRDSGTAATTRLIAVTTISSAPWPLASPMTSTMTDSTAAATASTRPTPASRRCSGVRPCRSPISAAIRPIALAAPVAVTTARPRPRTIVVPADTASRPAALSAGTDSPVSADSSTSSAAASTTSASAGTMSPSASTSTSPATNSVAGTVACSPSRSTRASGAVSSDSAAMALPAFTSWVTPAAVFTTITSRMTPASVQSPVASVSTAATSSTITSGSRSWPAISSQNEVRRARGSSFGPYVASLAAASAEDSPPSAASARRTPPGAPAGGPDRWLMA